MSVKLHEVMSAAHQRAAALAAEVAGYLALGAADQIAGAPRRVGWDDVLLMDDGSVRIGGGTPVDDAEAERVLREILGLMLLEASSVTPSLLRAAHKPHGAGVDALIRELEAALIPVNRAAARRALSRLHRDVGRARDNHSLRPYAAELARPAAPRITPSPVPAPAERPSLAEFQESVEMPRLLLQAAVPDAEQVVVSDTERSWLTPDTVAVMDVPWPAEPRAMAVVAEPPHALSEEREADELETVIPVYVVEDEEPPPEPEPEVEGVTDILAAAVVAPEALPVPEVPDLEVPPTPDAPALEPRRRRDEPATVPQPPVVRARASFADISRTPMLGTQVAMLDAPVWPPMVPSAPVPAVLELAGDDATERTPDVSDEAEDIYEVDADEIYAVEIEQALEDVARAFDEPERSEASEASMRGWRDGSPDHDSWAGGTEAPNPREREALEASEARERSEASEASMRGWRDGSPDHDSWAGGTEAPNPNAQDALATWDPPLAAPEPPEHVSPVPDSFADVRQQPAPAELHPLGAIQPDLDGAFATWDSPPSTDEPPEHVSPAPDSLANPCTGPAPEVVAASGDCLDFEPEPEVEPSASANPLPLVDLEPEPITEAMLAELPARPELARYAPPRYAPKKSSLDELLSGFSVADMRSERELCGDLKALAGVDGTAPPPEVALSETPPPVAVTDVEPDARADAQEREHSTARVAAGAATAALVVLAFGYSALHARVGGVSEATGAAASGPTASGPTASGPSEARVGVPSAEPPCAAELTVRKVPVRARTRIRVGPEGELRGPSRLADGDAIFEGLACREPVEVTVELPGHSRWVRIPVSGEALAPSVQQPSFVRFAVATR